MALIKVPDGGFYVDDSQVSVDYAKKSISIVGGGAGGGGLSLDGGTMNADAVINGTEELQITTADTGESGTVGITPQGVTIVHNTNSTADSRIRVIDNAIEITANNTTVTVNGTGVALGGAAISGVNSLAGQPSTEIAIESDVDMNSHNITNVGEISIANGLNIKADSGFTALRDSNGIHLSGENSEEEAGVMIAPENDQVVMHVVNGDAGTIISACKTTAESDIPAIVIGHQWDGDQFIPSGGGMTIGGDSTINFTSPQPINFNNNRLTGVANPTAGNDAVNLTYFQNNLPGHATTSTAGLVKQIPDIMNLSDQATLADVIAAFNNLLGYLRQAGIMATVE